MKKYAVPGAGAIIEKEINGKIHILLQTRIKKDREHENGLLEIPAGKIREFENIYDCLRREIKEETNLDLTYIKGESNAEIIKQNNYKVLNYNPFCCAQNIGKEYPILVNIFLCKAKGILKSNKAETKNLKWVKITKLIELLKTKKDRFYTMHISTLNKYLNYRKSNKSLGGLR